MHNRLICSATGESLPIDQLQNLGPTGKPLLAEYDLDSIKAGFQPDNVRQRDARSMWKFWEVMPVDRMSDAVSLGEGLTPLIPCEKRGPFAKYENLFIKDESTNPTGSFKARGMSAAVTRAKALGAKVVALPSAGNAAGAAAHYAANAGMQCFLFMPEDTPPANIIESVFAGANVFLVNGLISDCGKLVKQGCERFGWFDLSTLKEPFRVEGKKTMGYELPFDLERAPGGHGFQLPDVIFYPTGGGTGLIGMWKAFAEMEQLGWIGPERPKMVSVQAEGCAPVVKAYESGADHATMFPNAHTVASGLRVPAAVGDFLMLNAIRESGGAAISVSDDELMAGASEICRHQGVCACPEGGAVWKACEKLLASGWLDPASRIVLFNTGTGLKYNHLLKVGDLPVLDHNDPNCLDQIVS
ncbi:MAG: threonine synthase [Planctomycetaceae bacterium]|nr:threonine synthase [Planctomycetaceae bacterium]MCB9949907.1 threonine synthase [Planctomycetaceae bacterium]